MKLQGYTPGQKSLKIFLSKKIFVNFPEIFGNRCISFSFFPFFDEELPDLSWSLVSELAQIDGDQIVVNPGEKEVHGTDFLAKRILADIGEATAKCRLIE